jgi:hypothetical protein
MSDEAETSSAGGQLVRNNPTNENEYEAGGASALFKRIIFVTDA